MPTAVTTDPGLTFTASVLPTVDYAADLQSAWTNVPFLFCDELTLAVNAYSSALLHMDLGKDLLQPGGTSYSEYQPLNLRGKYVRITVPQTAPLQNIVWVGYVLSDNVQRDGVKQYGGVNKFEGEAQDFQCVGLEWFLDRVQNESSIVYPDIEIRRALKFNGGESVTLDMKAAHRGNRSKNVGGAGVFVFSDDPTSEDKFNAYDIVTYLLEYHTPKDKTGANKPCDYQLGPSSFGILSGFEPTISREHATTFALLNKTISPQRGLCWWCEFDEDFKVAVINVASMATTDLTLPGGGTFPANSDQITLNFDTEADVKNVELANLGHRRYHRVTARGARQTCTFTVGIKDGTLEPDWDDNQEIDYKDGAAGESDYPTGSAKQADRNDAVRVSDAFGRVYAYFRIPKDWDGKTGNGWLKTRKFAIAELSDSDPPSRIGGLPLNVQGIRLLNHLRLKSSVDYSDPTSPVSKAPDGSLEEFLRPFAFFRVEYDKDNPSDLSTNKNRWQLANLLGHSKIHGGGAPIAPNIHTTYNLHGQDGVPGLILRAGGAPNHTLALHHFDASDAGDAMPSHFKPQVSFDDLRATVCAEADFYASGVAEINPIPDGVPIEELIIDLGDDYRLDFLAENTVLEIANGLCKLAPTFGVIRDDREHLRDLASIALQWYSQDRQQLKVTFRQQRNLVSLGQLVTTIGTGTTQSEINTVISKIVYRFDKEGTTSIETVDQALDLRMVSGESHSRGGVKA